MTPTTSPNLVADPPPKSLYSTKHVYLETNGMPQEDWVKLKAYVEVIEPNLNKGDSK